MAGVSNILATRFGSNTIQYHALKYDYDLNNDPKVELLPRSWKCISFVKVEFVAELLYWISLHCIVVPNEVASEGIQSAAPIWIR